MRFIETSREAILESKKGKALNKELKNDLLKFLDTGFQYAEVKDDEGHYNNNNDLRRAIQTCIQYNNLPIIVFMYSGRTYVERL